MTVVLVVAGLAFVVGVLILRPFSTAGGRLRLHTSTSDEDRRRELLRQLRDLDDDLAAGKLTETDHGRLRDPVEREAAAVLGRIKLAGRAAGPAGATSGPAPAPPAESTGPRPRGRDAGGGARRWRRRTVTLVALAGALATVLVLLLGSIAPRSAGQNISGDAVGAVPALPSGSPSPDPSASASGQLPATPEQLAAIDAAVARVKQNPKDVSAHLALAGAYAAGGASQLAAVEYLAVTQLDPTNAEANTALGLLAFEVGQPAQGKTMVDRVLVAHPKYPEALYVRALILLMGLREPQAAERDLNAYLAVAPFGSHRTAAETLLALASSQEHQ